MKFLMPVFLIVLTGCVTPLGANSNQECAWEGMVLESVDFNSGTGVITGKDFTVTTTNASSTNRRCVKPQTPEDQCKIDVYQKSLIPIRDYNRQIGYKNLIVGLGYCAFLIPGWLALLHYNSQSWSYVDESSQIIKAGLKECMTKPSSH